MSWEQCNEDKLRTCQIKVLQKQCLLIDPNVSINTEFINTQELFPQRQQGLLRLLHPSVCTGGLQPSVARQTLTSFKTFASHPSLGKVIKPCLMSRTLQAHPPSQSPEKARWDTWICNQLQTLRFYKEAEANLMIYLHGKTLWGTQITVMLGHVQL